MLSGRLRGRTTAGCEWHPGGSGSLRTKLALLDQCFWKGRRSQPQSEPGSIKGDSPAPMGSALKAKPGFPRPQKSCTRSSLAVGRGHLSAAVSVPFPLSPSEQATAAASSGAARKAGRPERLRVAPERRSPAIPPGKTAAPARRGLARYRDRRASADTEGH